MAEPPTNDSLPTREELEREARRLARTRHLSVVRDEAPTPLRPQQPPAVFDPAPDPRPAA